MRASDAWAWGVWLTWNHRTLKDVGGALVRFVTAVAERYPFQHDALLSLLRVVLRLTEVWARRP